MGHAAFYYEIIEVLKNEKLSKIKLSKLKTRLSGKHKLTDIPTDIQILLNAPVKDINNIKHNLITKPGRTGSGVAIIAIMSKPMPCPHGTCTYCPGGPKSHFGDMPQSYTGKEPATRRAIRNKFNAYLQVMNRLEQYIVSGHIPDKAEVIVMGGTFPSYPKKYQEGFITDAFQALNDFSRMFFKGDRLLIEEFKRFFELPGDITDEKRTRRIQRKLLKHKEKTTLGKEHTRNESAKVRCVGLTIETRPDYGMLSHGNEMLTLGATRVEVGVETVYDEVLEEIQRKHSLQDTIDSTKALKDIGFKINYHVMPGLPNVSYRKDLKGLKELFDNPLFRPDMLKIYPCMVLKGTKLYDKWKKGVYKPLTTKKAAQLIADFKQYIPKYVRIMRVQRDIPTFVTEDGVDKTNLRQYIHQFMKEKGIRCDCIRCREVGRSRGDVTNVDILVYEYEASDGREYFISAEDTKNDVILGFTRLRFPGQSLRKEITKKSALIRELHVYGGAVSIGEKGLAQHRGYGKALIAEAERIARKHGKDKVLIISGVGVRSYYRKLGYKKEGPYMVKLITK